MSRAGGFLDSIPSCSFPATPQAKPRRSQMLPAPSWVAGGGFRSWGRAGPRRKARSEWRRDRHFPPKRGVPGYDLGTEAPGTRLRPIPTPIAGSGKPQAGVGCWAWGPIRRAAWGLHADPCERWSFPPVMETYHGAIETYSQISNPRGNRPPPVFSGRRQLPVGHTRPPGRF